MKRSALERKTPLKRSPSQDAPGRKPMKRSQPKRDWQSARTKVEKEGVCRCGPGYGVCEGKLEAAHIIGREHDKDSRNGFVWGRDSNALFVRPDRIVPLCTVHHRAYDAHELDLLPSLTLDEQVQAVRDAGGIENARRRTAPREYRT